MCSGVHPSPARESMGVQKGTQVLQMLYPRAQAWLQGGQLLQAFQHPCYANCRRLISTKRQLTSTKCGS